MKPSAYSYLDEGWEAERSKHVKTALKAMADICKDPKSKPSERIDAARTIDAISDSLLNFYKHFEMIGSAERVTERSSKRVADQIKKLKEDDEE